MPNSDALAPIETPRLRIHHVSLELYDCCIENRRSRAEEIVGAALPEDWYIQRDYLKTWRDKCLAEPEYLPWSLRIVVLKSAEEAIGNFRFHSTPNPEYLRATAPNAVEFGYRIYPPHRRKGFAKETALAMMQWAREAAPIEYFVVSISPGNVASQRLAASLGFIKVGEQMDEIDGPEDVLLLRA